MNIEELKNIQSIDELKKFGSEEDIKKILEKIVSTASSLGKTVLIINFPFPIVSDSFFGFHYSLAFSNVNIKRGNFLISILHRCKLKII